ncbi:unnamed protein product, partial [Phaeothamnion confervicola]
MDLGTVRQKLENGEYRGPSECAADIRLIWDNCQLYNKEGSYHHDAAVSLFRPQAFFSFAIQRAPDGSSGGGGAAFSAKRPPSTEERIRLCHALYKLRRSQAGKVVVWLDQRCPEAVEHVAGDQLELNLDAVDPPTFRKVRAGDVLWRRRGSGRVVVLRYFWFSCCTKACPQKFPSFAFVLALCCIQEGMSSDGSRRFDFSSFANSA